MYPNQGVSERATTTRYVPAQGRGPFFGLKDKLHFYNKHWPYPSNVEPEVPEPKHNRKNIAGPFVNSNWPFPAPKE